MLRKVRPAASAALKRCSSRGYNLQSCSSLCSQRIQLQLPMILFSGMMPHLLAKDMSTYRQDWHLGLHPQTETMMQP